MSEHVRTVLRDLGVTLQVPGVMALVSLPMCVIFDETYAVGPLLITAAVSFSIGQTLYRLFRDAEEMQVSHAMVTAVLTWTVVPILGAMPFVMLASRLAAMPGNHDTVLVLGEPVNAFFESMAGFTSTGLSMAVRPSELPHCLQWWRSLSQWAGGVGIILLTLSVFHPSGDARRLYFAEAGQDSRVPEIAVMARTIWWIYLFYTAVGILALRGSGMEWWPSINYAMAGISTGGFGIDDHSMAGFELGSQAVMLFVVVAGAVSFSIHHRLLTEARFVLLWRDKETRVLLFALGGGAAVLTVENLWSGAGSPIASGFQWASALVTAGFSTAAIETWSPSSKLLLCLAMSCGGAAGATTGGLRMSRVILLTQAAADRIGGVAMHPWRLMTGKPIASEKAEQRFRRRLEAATTMVVLWVGIVFMGTLLLLHAVGPTVGLDDVLFEVSSALNNVGLTTGITSPGLASSGKAALILLMWLGRLEIVPVLVLVAVVVAHPVHRLQGMMEERHSRR